MEQVINPLVEVAKQADLEEVAAIPVAVLATILLYHLLREIMVGLDPPQGIGVEAAVVLVLLARMQHQ